MWAKVSFFLQRFACLTDGRTDGLPTGRLPLYSAVKTIVNMTKIND